VNGQLQAPASFPLGKGSTPPPPLSTGCVGRGVGRDAVTKRKINPSAENKNTDWPAGSVGLQNDLSYTSSRLLVDYFYILLKDAAELFKLKYRTLQSFKIPAELFIQEK